MVGNSSVWWWFMVMVGEWSLVFVIRDDKLLDTIKAQVTPDTVLKFVYYVVRL